MSANKSVLEYLSTSSQEALEAFRISRLDRVSRLRAKIAELYEQWVQAQVDACAAEWMLDRRGAGDPTPRPRISTRADATSPPEARTDARAPSLRRLAASRENRLPGQLTLTFEVDPSSELELTRANGGIAFARDPGESGALPARELLGTAARDRPTLLMFPNPDIAPRGAISARGRPVDSTPAPRASAASTTPILRLARRTC